MSEYDYRLSVGIFGATCQGAHVAIGSIPVPLVQEPAFRLMAAVGVLVLCGALESVWPRRERAIPRVRRWGTHVGMVVLGTLLVRGLVWGVPLIAAAAAAHQSERMGLGLLQHVELGGLPEAAIALVLLDAAVWLQHVLSHRIAWLWRIHRVHHADRDLDATTALRFHPAELVLSAGYKAAVVFLLGPAVWVVALFEVLLNAAAVFNHANLALPKGLDRCLRLVLVTPDMHRVHHSVSQPEQSLNFGFGLPWWDRLLLTYQDEPAAGHEGMTLGLAEHQTEDPERLGWSLRFGMARDLEPK